MDELMRELAKAAAVRDWKTYFRLLQERAAASVKTAPVAPPPEHTSRDPWPEGFAIPAPAVSLKKTAEAAGWVTRVQYARAAVVCRRKVDGEFVTMLERRHSVAVKMWHAGRQLHAVAMWESPAGADRLSWKSSAAWLWGPGQLPCQVGVVAVRTALRSEEET